MDEFASPTGIDMNAQGYGTVRYGNPNNNLVIFYNKACHSPAKSAESGRPVYEEKIYVRIQAPGERLNIVDRPANRDDQMRYAMQWQQYQQNKQQIPEGTPIDLLYPDHPAVPATLRASGVHTIEQCANLSGMAIDGIGMGAQRYSNEAKEWLEKANKGVGIAQFRREIEDKDRQIKVLSGHVEALRHQVDELLTSARSSKITPEQIQMMLAGTQTRPSYMTGVAPPPGFDAASAQIAANHPTADIARQKRRAKRERLTG